MTLDAATRRNLELTETIRAGQVEGSLLQGAGLHRHPDGQTPAAPVGQQTPARPACHPAAPGRRRPTWSSRACCAPSCAPPAHAGRPGTPDQPRHFRPCPSRAIWSLSAPPCAACPKSYALIPGKCHRRFRPVLDDFTPAADELALLEAAISDDPPATLQNTGIIRPGYSAELDGVIEASRHARDWIANLEAVERERTGIKTLKVGYNKVFGYYIEISRGNTGSAPADYIRKQTLVNAERYITPEMKEYETLVLNAEERIREIEVAPLPGGLRQLADASRTPAGHRPRPGRTGCAGLPGRNRRPGRLHPPRSHRRTTSSKSMMAAIRWSNACPAQANALCPTTPSSKTAKSCA